MRFPFLHKHVLTVRVIPIALVAMAVKLIFNQLGWDAMPLSSLAGTIVSANVFLLGFLISGSLPDYKESEKIPGEMSASLDTLADEMIILHHNKKVPVAKLFLEHLAELADTIDKWFLKKAKTRDVMAAINGLNRHLAELESHTQANFITRMKQEQNNIRKMVIRVHTIRSTTFIATAYAIAEVFTAIVIVGLLFMDLGPLPESLFFTGAIAFLLCYMIALIKDLDNPFHYHENSHLDDEIALEPIGKAREKIREIIHTLPTDARS